MQGTNRNRRYGYGLALLALLVPVAAGGEEAVEESFRLHLDEAIEVGVLAAEPLATAERNHSELNLSDLGAIGSVAEFAGSAAAVEAQQEAQASSKMGGFGRWLKKHWYVPVLVGVLVGATALDDDNDG